MPPVAAPKRRRVHDKPRLSENEIEARLAAMHDTRMVSCVSSKQQQDGPALPTVSVIFTYHNDDFYALKLTLTSFLHFTPEADYTSVIVVDDGSDDDDVAKDASKFFSTHSFKALRMLRSESRDGEASSRFKASQIATGDILVFANHQVVFNKAWLPPLVEFLVDNPESIAMPHADNYIHNNRFFPLSKPMVHVMTLSLSTIHMEITSDVAHGNTFSSPVMRGDVYAISRSYYERLGAYDDAFVGGGGHDLELSLRAWMCGGGIKVVTCSRVAVTDVLTPRDVTDARNVVRIAELWLGAHRFTAYHQRDDVTRSSLQTARIH